MCLQYAINSPGAFSPCWVQYRPTPSILYIRTATHFKCHSSRLGFLKRWVFNLFICQAFLRKLIRKKARKSLNLDIKTYPCLIQFQVLTPSSGFLDFAISMRPDYHQAIIDTIRFYGWDKITYLYDSHDGE